MLSTGEFVQVLLPLYLIALIGFVARKLHVFQADTNQVITQLMLYITLPALILFSLNTTFSMELLSSFAWLLTMSIFILSISVIIAYWLKRRANLPGHQKSVYESLIVFGNQGFIGYAIIYLLMAEQGIVYLTVFNICYLLLIWTYGIFIFTRSERSVNWKVLFVNPGIVSTVIGLVMLLLPFSWPLVLVATFESVGKMTIPLSMLLIGSLLANLQWKDVRQYSRNNYLWLAASLRLLLLPLFLLVFLWFHVPYPLLLVAVLTSAMPSASTTSVYAQKFGGDASFASYGVILTTLLCMLTLPLLYSLLEWLYPIFY